MWHIGNVTTEYFTIPSVYVTLQFTCVTGVIFVILFFLTFWYKDMFTCFSLHILSIITDIKLLATIDVMLKQASYEQFFIYRNYR